MHRKHSDTRVEFFEQDGAFPATKMIYVVEELQWEVMRWEKHRESVAYVTTKKKRKSWKQRMSSNFNVYI